MISERTPMVEDLIESAMECKLAVKKKKEKTIESLRLQNLEPLRINRQVGAVINSTDTVQPFMGESTIQEEDNTKVRRRI